MEGAHKSKRKELPRYFGVFARFAIQVEGYTNGLQGYEDRLVIVMATSFEDAERRLKKDFSEYVKPYLNSKGEMVRWKFEEVLDVYDTGNDIIDPKGTEVYSVLKDRRMKPEYEWCPKYAK